MIVGMTLMSDPQPATWRRTMNAAAATDTNNEWIEKKVASLLRDLRRSGFWDSGIEEARRLRREFGYQWDVALKISCDYWCR